MRTKAMATVAMAAVCSTGFAASADAKGYDLWTATKITDGKAHGYGNVTFPAAKRFHVKGRINDICDGDGYGAYIEFKINFRGGGYARNLRKDTEGCKAGGKGYEFGHKFPKRIKSVGITVAEIDADTGELGDFKRKLIKR